MVFRSFFFYSGGPFIRPLLVYTVKIHRPAPVFLSFRFLFCFIVTRSFFGTRPGVIVQGSRAVFRAPGSPRSFCRKQWKISRFFVVVRLKKYTKTVA